MCLVQTYLCDEFEGGCNRVVGYLAVYRIMFAVACFYFLFFVTMLYVKNSRDPRAYIQNGYVNNCICWIIHGMYLCRFWFFKWLLLIGMIVGFFFIPVNGDLAFSKGCVVIHDDVNVTCDDVCLL